MFSKIDSAWQERKHSTVRHAGLNNFIGQIAMGNEKLPMDKISCARLPKCDLAKYGGTLKTPFEPVFVNGLTQTDLGK